MSRAQKLLYDEAYGKVQRGFYRQEKDGLSWVYAKSFLEAGAQQGFTTRRGGVSRGEALESLNFAWKENDSTERIEENYRRLAKAIGVSVDSMVRGNQVHGENILCPKRTEFGSGLSLEKGALPNCDGLISEDAACTLVSTHGDCMAISLFEPLQGVVSQVHSGWKGTSLGIASKAVRRMVQDFSGKPSEIRAAIGPSISQRRFEVDKPVYDIFLEKFPDVDASYYDEETRKYHIDLWKIMVAQLVDAGISPENICLAGLCTYDLAEDYFSYRRDGIACGLMLGFIRKDGR